MSSASEASIASAALVWLGRDEIATLDDADDANARLLKSRYAQVRDAVLRSYPWNFALEYVRLAGHPLDRPMFGFAHRCPLPAGGEGLPYCLRVWRVETEAAWTVRGRYLYTVKHPPITMEYVRREANPEVYDPLFSELVAIELALALPNRIAADDVRRRMREMQAERRRLRREATLGDAMEASPKTAKPLRSSWLNARKPM